MHNQTAAPGVQVLVLPQERFTTTHMTVGFSLPLGDRQAAFAILPYLLRRRSAAYPDMTRLNRQLMALYSTVIEMSMEGVGDCAIMTVDVDMLRDRVVPKGDRPSEKGVAVLTELLFRPYFTDGTFDEEDLAIAKRCLTEQIRADINEKRRYARQACIQRMYDGTPYAAPLLGTEEQVAALTAAEVTAAWRTLLSEATVQIILQGADDPDGLLQPLYRALAAVERRPITLPKTAITDRTDCRRDEEHMELNQCKLVMGLFTSIAGDSRSTDAMRVVSGLLGGTVCSLLFRHVREEKSLCYYCSSYYNRHKGFILVDSGVQPQKVEEVEKEILHWLDAIKNGDFTEEELADVKRAMQNDCRTAQDDQGALSNWLLGAVLGYTEMRSPADVADALETVTKQEVIAVAATLRLGMVFRLTPKEDAV